MADLCKFQRLGNHCTETRRYVSSLQLMAYDLNNLHWYHATYADCLPAIQMKGLIGRAHHGGPGNFDHEGVDEQGVFLRGNENMAFMWERLDENRQWAMLRMTGLDPERIRIDPEMVQDYCESFGRSWNRPYHERDHPLAIEMEAIAQRMGTSLVECAKHEPGVPFYARMCEQLSAEAIDILMGDLIETEVIGSVIYDGSIGPEQLEVYDARADNWMPLAKLDVARQMPDLDYTVAHPPRLSDDLPASISVQISSPTQPVR